MPSSSRARRHWHALAVEARQPAHEHLQALERGGGLGSFQHLSGVCARASLIATASDGLAWLIATAW